VKLTAPRLKPSRCAWRAVAAGVTIANDRSMPQRGSWLARDRMRALQDAREPAARCGPPAAAYADLKARSVAEIPLLSQGEMGARGAAAHCQSYFRTFFVGWWFPSQPPIPFLNPDTGLCSRGAERPGAVQAYHRNRRVQGVPGARRTRGLVCSMRKAKAHTSIEVRPKHPGISCA
jgi:hypothetical protein